MRPKTNYLVLLLAISIFGAMGYAVWRYFTRSSAQNGGRIIAYYQDSMHPWIKSEKSGKCTICLMDLTPIFEGDAGFGGSENLVVLSTNSITVLNVQTEEVKFQPIARTLRVAGTLEANEARRSIISAPAPGRIQSLGVDYAGVEVQAGQTLVSLVSAELIQKRAYLRAANVNKVGVANDFALASEKADPFSSVLPAPHAGIVVERAVAPGQFVLEGEKLLTIVDSSVVWFRFDVYQRQLPWFTLGQNIEVTVEGVPGKVFPAVIKFIEPTLNDATRTVKVRADIQNPVAGANGQRLLRFGMYAEGRVRAATEKVVTVPRSAILSPGGATYTYLDKGNGAYERRRVKLGRQGDELWEVLAGLEEDDRVVTSGNVLIDAQAQFNQGYEEDSGTEQQAAADSEDGWLVADVTQSPGLGGAHVMAPAGTGLNPSELKALREFLGVADGISRALAADNLDQVKQHTRSLSNILAATSKTFGGDLPWQDVFSRLEATADWPVLVDLAAARKHFLSFSTNVVELVQRVRQVEESLRSLKVYYCPMAPKPGLWFQEKGPLRNPYFGADMLACGEEVRRSSDRAATAHMPQIPDSDVATATPKMVMATDGDATNALAAVGAKTNNSPADATSGFESADQLDPENRGRNRLQVGYARKAQSEEMRAKRWAAIVEAHGPTHNVSNGPAANPVQPPIVGIRYENLVPMPADPSTNLVRSNVPPASLAPRQP